jgi:hypothetical protein
MLGKSFPSIAGVVLPRANACKLALAALAVAFVVAGCGGSSATKGAVQRIAGSGYSFRVPDGWTVRRRAGLVEARSGGAVVSVAVTALAKPFRPSLWAEAVKEMDTRAHQFAAAAGTTVDRGSTRQIGGRRARVYDLADSRRLAFVLQDRRNYTLYCRHAGSACGELLASFRVSAA